MLNLLSGIFGPHRAVSIYVFLRARGLILLALVGFAGVVASLLLLTGPGAHEHVGFHRLPVVSKVETTNGGTTSVVAKLRLPSGEVISVSSTESAIAALVTETACVEERRFVDTGEARYRIKSPHHCASQ